MRHNKKICGFMPHPMRLKKIVGRLTDHETY
jgi:hypothetical protein